MSRTHLIAAFRRLVLHSRPRPGDARRATMPTLPEQTSTGSRSRHPPPRSSRPPSRNRLVLTVYTAAIFVSALLLFSVQPMFTKMVLPRLGGSPAVWSVAMVFFQTLLLAGYAYAHFLMQMQEPHRSGRGASGAAGCGLRHAAARRSRSAYGEPPTSRLRRSGCSACSRCRSACRSSRSPPTTRCCRPGSCAPATPTGPIPISSMRRPISAAFWRCCPIRSCWSRCSRCARRT